MCGLEVENGGLKPRVVEAIVVDADADRSKRGAREGAIRDIGVDASAADRA